MKLNLVRVNWSNWRLLESRLLSNISAKHDYSELFFFIWNWEELFKKLFEKSVGLSFLISSRNDSTNWRFWIKSTKFVFFRLPADGGEQRHFPPSFRIHRGYSFGPGSGGQAGPAGRDGSVGSKNKHRKSRFINQLKRGTSAMKSVIPKIKDVNVIDKYSRLIFPVSFLLFNVAYWCFYVFEV